MFFFAFKKRKKKCKKIQVGLELMTSESVFTACDPTYTTTDKLSWPIQIEVVNSLRALPFTRSCINSDRKSRLASTTSLPTT